MNSGGVNVSLIYSKNPPNWKLLSYAFVTYPYYAKKYPDFGSGYFKESIPVNQVTIEHFSKIWIGNYFSNLIDSKEKSKLYLLTQQSFKWKETNILFVGGAPTLENEIEEIREKRENFFLLSSDTSSNFLLYNKVIPDAILSVDSGRGTSYHFRENFPDHIPIITWLGANKEIFRKSNPIYLIFTSHPLDQVMASLLSLSTISNPGLNIATLALSIASEFDIKDFGVSGVSFQSLNGKTHCRGTGYESYYSQLLNRKVTLENYSPGYYRTNISIKNQHTLNVLINSKYGLKTIHEFGNHKVIQKELGNAKKNNLPISQFFASIVKKDILGEMIKVIGTTKHEFMRYIKYYYKNI